MKRLSFLLVMALMVFVTLLFGAGDFGTANGSYTENDYNNFITYTFSGEIDKSDTITSNAIEIKDQDFIDFPVIAGYELTKDSVGDTIATTVTVLGSIDGTNYVTIDTVGTISSETYGTTKLDFGNAFYKYYKLKLVGGATQGNDATFEIVLAVYKKNKATLFRME